MVKFNPNIDLNYNAEIIYTDIVCLKPFELYCQINEKIPDLLGQYNIYVVDHCNNILDNITNHFIINETPTQTQFEFYLKKSYYISVKLKLQNINTNAIYYSNYFICKENPLTLRIDYNNIGELVQSSRINGIFTNLEIESDVKTYIQETGTKISNKAILTEFRNYIIDKIDNFTYREFNYALAKTNIYIDSLRISDKPTLKTSEIEGSSNFFSTNFKGAIKINDTYINIPQLFPKLIITDYLPKGLYLPTANIPNYLFQFNYNVQINSNENILVYENNNLLDTINNANLTINNNIVTAQIQSIQIGTYRVEIPANKFINEFGLKNEYIEYDFIVRLGDFLGTDFNNNDFFTN